MDSQELAGARLVTMCLRGVSKAYPGVRALADVDLDLVAGEVTGLVGENGAGKSTLLKIATGVEQPSKGRIELDGEAVKFSHPLAARAAGVVAVYQELAIIPGLSALANVFLGRERSSRGFLRRRAMMERYDSLSEQLNVKIDPERRAGTLSVADRQSLEILRSLASDSRILILDEPTATLGPTERAALYEIVDRLKAHDVALLVVTHDLDEALRLSDHITVLRDGKRVADRPTGAWTRDGLVTAMLGDNLSAARTKSRESLSGGNEALRAENVTVPGKIRGVSLRVGAGEILGIAGLVGAGKTELLRALAGLDPTSSGALWVAGKQVGWPHSVRASLRRGIALAPEDRKDEGLCLSLPAYANITLGDAGRFARNGLLTPSTEVERTRPIAAQVALQAGALTRGTRGLSGGTQQKLVLAKWLERPDLTVLLVDEPARGVDVGAKVELFATLARLADRGLAVVLVSSELEEVVDHSDRIVVLSRGTAVGEFDARATTEEQILQLIFATEKEYDE